jgi:NAD(P)-dependent dehydrogenase (short-subunit alcohol dehydrogenase family)
MDWSGKVVVITGGASGIGAGCGKLFAEKGAKVVLFDPNEAGAQAIAGEIGAAGGQALVVGGDVSAEEDVMRLLERTVSHFGRVDGLVNNAGVMTRHAQVEDWTLAEIRKVLEVNLLGQFYATYLFAPAMEKDGGGFIVNIASVGAISSIGYSPAYGSSKAGVLGLTRSIAPALAAKGIRTNAVLPGFTDTGMTADSPMRATLAMMTPLDLARGIEHVAGLSSHGGFYVVDLSKEGPVLRQLTDPPPQTPVTPSPFG